MFQHDKVFEFEDKAVKVHHQGDLTTEFTLFRSKEAKEEKLKYVQKALGGEMEAKGIYKAAERGGFEWIVIKAIVDWGTEEKDKSGNHLELSRVQDLYYSAWMMRMNHKY